MIIEAIYSNPKRFEITKLSGGFFGRAEKVRDKINNEQFVLKPMGNTDEQIAYSLVLLEHIKCFGEHLKNMAKVCDWALNKNGALFALFEFIDHTENRLASVAEMIQISNLSFQASKNYQHTKVGKEVDFRRTVLYEITNNGAERYREKYFLPHVNEETYAVIDWMSRWAQYFIKEDEFKTQYLECVGFIHRDIHRHNIVLNDGIPYLIDFDFSGVDCRLIEITRPTNVYMDVGDFLPMYTKAKEVNDTYLSETEKGIIDRVLVLDIMANLGWEANEIFYAEEGEYKNGVVRFLQPRLSCLHLLLKNKSNFNLDFL